ncbi:MAG: hypothetical protein PHU23_19205 [Dehalococcoidales bacterium]|nr:hypothetical protein [Dehalococcoidales bacterium]
MRRITIALLILASVCLVPVYSASSHIGVDGGVSFSKETSTISFGGASVTGESTGISGQFILNGVTFFDKTNLGIGYMAGFGKAISGTLNGEDVDVSNYPLSWLVGLTGVYHISVNSELSAEIGAGLLYESSTDSEEIEEGTTVDVTVSTISIVLNGGLVYNLTENLAVSLRGIISTPMYTTWKFSSGGFSYEQEVRVVGIAGAPQIGIVYTF